MVDMLFDLHRRETSFRLGNHLNMPNRVRQSPGKRTQTNALIVRRF